MISLLFTLHPFTRVPYKSSQFSPCVIRKKKGYGVKVKVMQVLSNTEVCEIFSLHLTLNHEGAAVTVNEFDPTLSQSQDFPLASELWGTAFFLFLFVMIPEVFLQQSYNLSCIRRQEF